MRLVFSQPSPSSQTHFQTELPFISVEEQITSLHTLAEAIEHTLSQYVENLLSQPNYDSIHERERYHSQSGSDKDEATLPALTNSTPLLQDEKTNAQSMNTEPLHIQAYNAKDELLIEAILAPGRFTLTKESNHTVHALSLPPTEETKDADKHVKFKELSDGEVIQFFNSYQALYHKSQRHCLTWQDGVTSLIGACAALKAAIGIVGIFSFTSLHPAIADIVALICSLVPWSFYKDSADKAFTLLSLAMQSFLKIWKGDDQRIGHALGRTLFNLVLSLGFAATNAGLVLQNWPTDGVLVNFKPSAYGVFAANFCLGLVAADKLFHSVVNAYNSIRLSFLSEKYKPLLNANTPSQRLFPQWLTGQPLPIMKYTLGMTGILGISALGVASNYSGAFSLIKDLWGDLSNETCMFLSGLSSTAPFALNVEYLAKLTLYKDNSHSLHFERYIFGFLVSFFLNGLVNGYFTLNAFDFKENFSNFIQNWQVNLLALISTIAVVLTSTLTKGPATQHKFQAFKDYTYKSCTRNSRTINPIEYANNIDDFIKAIPYEKKAPALVLAPPPIKVISHSAYETTPSGENAFEATNPERRPASAEEIKSDDTQAGKVPAAPCALLIDAPHNITASASAGMQNCPDSPGEIDTSSAAHPSAVRHRRSSVTEEDVDHKLRWVLPWQNGAESAASANDHEQTASNRLSLNSND